MLDEARVRAVIATRLLTVTGLPDPVTGIAWENRNFDPPQQLAGPGLAPLWIREHQQVLSETRSSTGFVEAIGISQFLVETPSGKGTEEADKLSKAIAEAFEAGQSLTEDGLTVILEHCERSAYRSDFEFPAWIFKTVTVRWRTFTPALT